MKSDRAYSSTTSTKSSIATSNTRANFCTAFGQKRRPWIAGMMGIVGYSVGWFIWQASVTYAIPEYWR